MREADVFSQGYRPGALGNRGLSPEEFIKLRPGFVYVSLCALSHQGPWASRRGFHYIARMSCEVRGIETLNECGRGLSFANELWRYVTTGTGMLTHSAYLAATPRVVNAPIRCSAYRHLLTHITHAPPKHQRAAGPVDPLQAL